MGHAVLGATAFGLGPALLVGAIVVAIAAVLKRAPPGRCEDDELLEFVQGRYAAGLMTRDQYNFVAGALRGD